MRLSLISLILASIPNESPLTVLGSVRTIVKKEGETIIHDKRFAFRSDVVKIPLDQIPVNSKGHPAIFHQPTLQSLAILLEKLK